MKILIHLLVISIYNYGFSQKPNKKINIAPVIYLDSVRVTSLGIFDPQKIESISEIKDYDSTAFGGKIFVKSKNPNDYKFLSASEIAKIYNFSLDSSLIFMVDDKIVIDTANFRIDSSYIVKVNITRSEIGFYPHNSNFRFLKIYTPEYVEPVKKKRKRKSI